VAGGPGPQRRPIDVQLAENRYAHSTGMWTQCGGAAAPEVTFYTGQSYQHLAGTLGIDSSAPDGMSVQVLVYADDGVWQWFNVQKDANNSSTWAMESSFARRRERSARPTV
jgi:hypothetical protein